MSAAGKKGGGDAKAAIGFGRHIASPKQQPVPPKKAASGSPKKFGFEQEAAASGASESLPYRLQGDKKMYTKKALALRKELSVNPNVKEAIDDIWKAVCGKNESLSRVNYMKIFMGICKMLNPAMEYEEALEIVQNDFERDAKGADSLDYSKFYDAVFELVDKWTIDISAQEYVAFLKTLLSRMQ